jgi:tetratricopeptide (TPR) repeat protein
VTALALLALAGFTWRAPLAAGWIANRAATRMAKVELALFPQPDTVQRLSPAQLDSLRAEFERALQLDPRNLTALTRLGRIAMLGEDYAAASGYYERVLALAPDHPAAPHQLGFAYLWQQRRGEAYAVLRPHDNEVTGDLVFYVGYWNQNGRPELADEASALLALLGP